MPQIKEYKQNVGIQGPISAPGRRADGNASLARGFKDLGAGISEFGTAIAETQKRREISTIGAELSTLSAETNQSLSDGLSKVDPNDTQFVETQAQALEEKLSKIRDRISYGDGLNYFEKASAAIRSDFSTKAKNGMAELAGLQAKQDFLTMVNSSSAATLASPSSYATSKQLIDENLEARVTGGIIPRELAIRLQSEAHSELSKSAVRGWIEIAPEEAKSQLDSGQWDASLGAQGKTQLYGELDRAIRAREVEEERRIALQERALERERSVTKNRFIESAVEGSLSTKEILKSNLSAEQKEHYLGLVRRESKAREKTDPSVENALLRRILLPDGDPDKIRTEDELLGEFQRGGLDGSGLKRLMSWVSGKNTVEGRMENSMKKQVLDSARSKLVNSNPMLGIRDPAGEEQFLRFTIAFDEELKRGQNSGKSMRELLDPDSKEYLGKLIPRFVRSPEEIMQETVKSMAPPLTEPTPLSSNISPRLPGETPAQWRARTKGTN